jgi:hypothetical protein
LTISTSILATLLTIFPISPYSVTSIMPLPNKLDTMNFAARKIGPATAGLLASCGVTLSLADTSPTP